MLLDHMEEWYAIERTIEDIARFMEVDRDYLRRWNIVIGNGVVYELQCQVEDSTKSIVKSLRVNHSEWIRKVIVLVSRVEWRVKKIFQSSVKL